MNVISSSDFADCFGVTPQAARKALSSGAAGRQWRGYDLPVMEVTGERGGASGRSWGLVVDALEPELKARFNRYLTTPLNSIEQVINAGATEGATALACWRWSVIRDAMALPAGSKERAAKVAQIATATQHFNGSDQTLSKTTIYKLINDYEANGFGALLPKARADRGKSRVLITKVWDREIDLSGDAKVQVSDALETYAKRFVRSDGSMRKLVHIGARHLVELCETRGSDVPPKQLAQICKLNQRWAQPFNEYKRVARKDRDAKLHFDHDQPRISRHRSKMPGEVVFGDVNPVDLWVVHGAKREQVRVRLIAWIDDCTHMLKVTPVLFLKGRGVRQSDIVDSFYDLTSDPHFGLPGTSYLDNGSEYFSLFNSSIQS